MKITFLIHFLNYIFFERPFFNCKNISAHKFEKLNLSLSLKHVHRASSFENEYNTRKSDIKHNQHSTANGLAFQSVYAFIKAFIQLG